MGPKEKSYAFVSVSDKTGVVEICKWLIANNIGIISTGGTAKALTGAGLAVLEVSEYTGFPEMMDGRLKTLHPLVHGGILGREEDVDVMTEHGMFSIDYVIVNLYPFSTVVADPQCTKKRAVENIDIGGPTMLRAGAKNHYRVLVICDPGDYQLVMEICDPKRPHVNSQVRGWFAHKVFAHTAAYDATIAAELFRFMPRPGS